MAASSSSVQQQPSAGSSRTTGGEDVVERRFSPIPYRIGPLAYQPGVNCFCGTKAARWISWSDDNPGRRYLKCYRAREGGCNFGGWYDGQHEAFVQTLLIDLRDAVWNLKREKQALHRAIADAAVKAEEEKEAAVEAEMELAAVRAKMQEMEAKMQSMVKERFLLRALLVVAFALVVFVLLGQK